MTLRMLAIEKCSTDRTKVLQIPTLMTLRAMRAVFLRLPRRHPSGRLLPLAGEHPGQGVQ